MLVIDDNPQIRDVVHRVLTSAGYRVTTAASGLDALTLLDDPDVTADLVLTNVVMPGITGNAFAAQLHARRPDMKILFMSDTNARTTRARPGPGKAFRWWANPSPGPRCWRRSAGCSARARPGPTQNETGSAAVSRTARGEAVVARPVDPGQGHSRGHAPAGRPDRHRAGQSGPAANERQERQVGMAASALSTSANQVLADAVNAETGVRGYVATGNPLFLDPYNLTLTRLAKDHRHAPGRGHGRRGPRTGAGRGRDHSQGDGGAGADARRGQRPAPPPAP